MEADELKESKIDGSRWGQNKSCIVLGWKIRYKNREKLYVLQCEICKKDSELWGDAIFQSTLGNLKKGKVSCGCGKNVNWTEKQYQILCERKCRDRGYEFIRFEGNNVIKISKVVLSCPVHSLFSSLSIADFLSGRSCPKCANKTDDQLINEFISIGGFSTNDKFKRSERKTKQGAKSYWYVTCGDCGETNETFIGNIKQGNKSCRCNGRNQKQAYINIVKDGDVAIALKFGITKNSTLRLKQQSSKTTLTVENFGVWNFIDSDSCKIAEKVCKENFKGSLILKRDFPDGFTETTDINNLNDIITIYENYGGVYGQSILIS